jgi:hypothetical protein
MKTLAFLGLPIASALLLYICGVAPHEAVGMWAHLQAGQVFGWIIGAAWATGVKV